MTKNRFLEFIMAVHLTVFGIAGCSSAPRNASPSALDPATMQRIASVDERFQSYNIEMVEVIGGRFWKPYNKQGNHPPKNPRELPKIPGRIQLAWTRTCINSARRSI